MKKYLTLLFIGIPFFMWSQVTLRVTSIPTNTPAGASIYVAGSFNGWNPMSAAHVMIPDENGAWELTIPEGTGTVEYKFTRGGWPTAEGNANGGFLPNRSFTFTGQPQTLNLTILSWEDLGGTNSTAAENVSVLDTQFWMPQLNRSRRIWLYLPPDYQTSEKHYPVIYMKDGQNIFDAATSFSGEWQVDETLNTLFANGDYGAIVVGIDNGGAERLNEYSPWNNSQYGGGQGALYMDFVAETLKPFIDENYRTLPQSATTALFGSSMGALISTYGAIEYAEIFKKVGAFSPAYWFSLTQLNNYITNTTSDLNEHRMYFLAGQNESSTMVPNLNAIRNALITKGLSTNNAFTKIDANGTHSESYWRAEFGAAYQWLFENTVLSEENFLENPIEIFPLNDGQIYVSGIKNTTKLQLFDLQGKNLGTQNLYNGVNKIIGNFQSGIYIGKISIENGFQNFKILIR
jgi:predicted alpha/beta superfamily hydrolase